MKIFIDTNVWIRYLVRDNEASYKQCLNLVNFIKDGKVKPYTSNIVFLEVYYTMTKYYQADVKEVIDSIEKLLKARNLTLIEKTDFAQALKWHKKYQIKLADCLIATQIPPKTKLCTYDKDFIKIPQLTLIKPEDLNS